MPKPKQRRVIIPVQRNEMYSRAPVMFPADLQPRVIRNGPFSPGSPRVADQREPPDELIKRIADNTDILALTQLIERGLTATQYTVTTAPVEIVDGKQTRGYILLNPSQSSGLTTSGTMFASAARTVAGSPYTSTAIGVANYLNLAFFIDVTVFGAGSLIAVNLQTQDPVTLNWATAQPDIFPAAAITAVGTYYANTGSLGADVAARLVASLTVASSTFSVSYVQKNGLPGGTSGLANTVFIGGPNVNAQTGYPLLEGQQLKIFTRENTKLFAVSLGSATLSVFNLQ